MDLRKLSLRVLYNIFSFLRLNDIFFLEMLAVVLFFFFDLLVVSL